MDRYTEKLTEILRAYALAGLVATGLVPTPLVATGTIFIVTFRHAGELHSRMGTFVQHQTYAAQLTR